MRLREITATLEISERGMSGIVTDLADAGYVVKDKHGRRNRYRIHADLPLPEAIAQQLTIGEALELLIGPSRQEPTRHLPTDHDE